MSKRPVFALVALRLVVAARGVRLTRRPMRAEPCSTGCFCMDGTSLISYGEFARVADRVVFSIPIGDAARVASAAAREHSAGIGRLGAHGPVRRSGARAALWRNARRDRLHAAQCTGDRSAQPDCADERSSAAPRAWRSEARGNLARWPSQNFGYRASDVAQLVGMLDEVISELRVAAGQSSFDLSLVANITLPAAEELLPAPEFRETMEQALAAAAATPEPAERISLLDAISTALQEPARAGGWAAALRLRARRRSGD